MARGMRSRSLSFCRAVMAFVAIPCLVSLPVRTKCLCNGPWLSSRPNGRPFRGAYRRGRGANCLRSVAASAAGRGARRRVGLGTKMDERRCQCPGVDRARGLRGGYVYWPVVSPEDKVMLLEAAGHNLAYVNGQIRAGDPYANGYVRLPVQLRAGTNDFLFQCSRGRLRAKLVPVSARSRWTWRTRPCPICAWARSRQRGGGGSDQRDDGIHDGGAPRPRVEIAGAYRRIARARVFKVPFLVRPPRLKAPGKYQAALELTDARGRNGTGSDRGHAAGPAA